eukprot:g2349.t1
MYKLIKTATKQATAGIAGVFEPSADDENLFNSDLDDLFRTRLDTSNSSVAAQRPTRSRGRAVFHLKPFSTRSRDPPSPVHLFLRATNLPCAFVPGGYQPASKLMHERMNGMLVLMFR